MHVQNTEYRIQNTEYRIQNVGPSLTWTVTDGADPVGDKDLTADAVGLQTAQTNDHESGEPQERLRFEPSIPGTHSVWAHRLCRATQSGTEDWRGDDIEANENRSTSIQDTHESPRMNAHLMHFPMHTTYRQLVSSPPPPPVWFHLLTYACFSPARCGWIAIVCFSVSAFAFARPCRSMIFAGWACS